MVFSLTLDVARSSANSKMLELVLNKLVKEVLPDEIAKTVLAKGSNLAHIYGLPKTDKPQLAMHPILSAVGTYNYKLAKWLDEKLKPLLINRHTISNILGGLLSTQEARVALGYRFVRVLRFSCA